MATPSKNEFIVPNEAETTEVKSGSDVTLTCHLSSEISAVDMEIRWFKGTDCVCLYMEGQMIAGVGYKGRVGLNKMKTGNISLELKDVRESDDGDYLCQVTSEDRTEEKTVRLSLKNHEDTEMLQTEETTPEQTVLKKKMEKSALMAVFSEWKDTSKCLEKAKQESKEKEAEIEELKAKLLQTFGKPEKENTQLENTQETSQLELDNPETKATPLEKQQLNIEELKVFTLYIGNKNALHAVHKSFIGTLRNQILNLREVGTVDESDVVLIFCPIVSRAGTDIDAALKIFKSNTGSKLTVLVVLHHTFDPEKIVPDSSRCVKRTDILTVDYLFYEDTGLLKCQKNSQSTDKVVNWLIQQGEKTGVNIRPCGNKGIGSFTKKFSWRQVKKQEVSGDINYFLSVTGDAKKHHVHFIEALQKKMNLREVPTVQESDVILLFCPDISGCHQRTDRPVVLISLHQTLDPDNSKRRAVCSVDYIFHEGEGLIECQINNDEISAVSRWLKDKKQRASRNKHQSSPVPPVSTSSHPVSYFTNLTGDAKKHLFHFIETTRNQICLNEVFSVEDSDVILLFCPDISDCNKRTDKPVVLISLHNTLHSDSVPSSNEFVNRRDILPLDCIFIEGEGLANCIINQAEYSVFSQFLSTKIIKDK